jgi:hypothetical protein
VDQLVRIAREADEIRKERQDAVEQEERRVEEEEQRAAFEREQEERRHRLARLRDDSAALNREIAEYKTRIEELGDEPAEEKARNEQRSRRGSFEREIATREKKLERPSRDIERLEKELERQFVSEPRRAPALAAAGGRAVADSRGLFVPPPAGGVQRFDVPEKRLPRVGRLHEDKNGLYLVIEDWQDLPVAEEEARRLDAIVMAPSGGAR